MGDYVVAVSIDKVQTFLYYVLQAYIQENQANSGTLREIVNSSQLISETFFRDIGIEGEEGEFSDQIEDRLLTCSGMCIFTTSLDREQITEKLGRLFRKYYQSFKGQLLVKYAVLEKKLSTDEDKLGAITESKNRLKQRDCLNEIISSHRDLLFQFCSVPEGNKLPLSSEPDKKYPAFSRDINALYSQQESDNDNHFRIAVIKADLDGMGDLFQQLGDYAIYNAISQVLSKFISLDYLHMKAGEYQKKYTGFKLYPLYMAGDDIFFAVTAAHLLEGVSLCKEILVQLNKEIAKLKTNTKLPQLSMSVGIDFTFNREPIRYYYERVQRQLDEAKTCSRNDKDKVEKSSYMKISINDYILKDYDAKKKSPWAYFIDDIALLKGAMKKGFAAHHFLYGLLSKISDKTIGSSEVKFSNAVLYHLLPEHLDSGNKELREYELLLIEKLLRQLLAPKEEHSYDRRDNSNQQKKSEKVLKFGFRERKRLERYVRMLLLFSDQRFAMDGDKVLLTRFDFDKKRIRSTLFNKPLRYLYHQSLYGSLNKNTTIKKHDVLQFRNIFTVSTKYNAPNRPRVQAYRDLQISSSMFHRFKKMDKGQIGTVAEMLQSVNDRSKEDIKKLEAQRKSDKKAPPGLFFDEKAFREVGAKTNLWTDDYIDSLLIFYRLNELSIQYKTLYRDNNNKNKKANKQHRPSKGDKR
ncbi:Cas10/Cmr2 second palm domain-containing protein [Halalkalibacter oceani]|uniref:Cas10/Cmr2 second palm domain-containing protein n=1 Tax=Halalkalibacter oceani TaxID=1653776 RepID=UPI0033955126